MFYIQFNKLKSVCREVVKAIYNLKNLIPEIICGSLDTIIICDYHRHEA